MMSDRKGPRLSSREELDLFHKTVGDAGAAGKPPTPNPAAGTKPRASRGVAGPTKGAKVDARLDLHGLTLDAAHKALDGFMERAQGAGQTRLLIITGKGGRGRGKDETHMESRARLSVKVPLWLERRAGVASVERASRRHGGEGALYVILKGQN